VEEMESTKFQDLILRNTKLSQTEIPVKSFYTDDRLKYTVSDFNTADGFPPTREYTYTHEVRTADKNFRFLYKSDDTTVYMMLQGKTDGWIGIGFNPDARGTMVGGDMIRCYAALDEPVIKDEKSYSKVGQPALDDSQDVKLQAAWTENSWSTCAFSRPRDTKDTINDTILKKDEPTLVVLTYEPYKGFKYHGPNIKGTEIQFSPSMWQEVEFVLSLSSSQELLATLLCAIGLLLTICLFIFQFKYRTLPTILYSSPRINNVLLFGIALGYAAIPMFTLNASHFCDESLVSTPTWHEGEEYTATTTTTTATTADSADINTPLNMACEGASTYCSLRLWLLSLAFTFIFGSMFSKTYRVYRLLVQTKKSGNGSSAMKKVKINDTTLLMSICILFLIDLIILSLWEGVNAFDVKRAFTGVISKAEDGNIYQKEVEESCTTESDAFYVILLGYKVLLMLGTAVMGHATRNVELEDMKDFPSIGGAVYSVLIILCVVLPSLSLLEGNPSASFLLSVGSIFLSCTSTVLILYIPKIQDIFFGTGGQRSSRSALSSAASYKVSNANSNASAASVASVADAAEN
jgi:hypothetical protein